MPKEIGNNIKVCSFKIFTCQLFSYEMEILLEIGLRIERSDFYYKSGP